MYLLAFLLLSPRHPHVEKSSHSSHAESLVFKQPPPLEPPLSSPPQSIRDPPWPHGGTPPGRPSPSDRPSTQSQRKDFSLAPAVPGHRIPRPYNKVASSEYKRRGLAHLEKVNGWRIRAHPITWCCRSCWPAKQPHELKSCCPVFREGVWLGQTLRRPRPWQEESVHPPPDLQCKFSTLCFT